MITIENRRLVRHILKVFCLALLLIGVDVETNARDFSALQAEVWIDLEPMGPNGPNPSLPREESIKALLTEAQFIFSGMIYGFDFEYRPSDTARKAEEKFSFIPSTTIPWGDPGLTYTESRNQEDSIFLRVRYFPKDSEIKRLEAWASADLQDAGGTGFASYYLGTPGRLKSILESCKNAIRNCVRGMVHNKPSHIQGKLVLSEVPRIEVISGQFRTDVRVRIDISEIEEYRNY